MSSSSCWCHDDNDASQEAYPPRVYNGGTEKPRRFKSLGGGLRHKKHHVLPPNHGLEEIDRTLENHIFQGSSDVPQGSRDQRPSHGHQQSNRLQRGAPKNRLAGGNSGGDGRHTGRNNVGDGRRAGGSNSGGDRHTGGSNDEVSLEALREAYIWFFQDLRRFCDRPGIADTFLPQYPVVVRYVRELQSKNDKLSTRCETQENAVADLGGSLSKIGHKIETEMRKLDPGVVESASEDSPLAPTHLVDVLLVRYEGLVAHLHDQNLRLKQKDEELGRLQQKHRDREASHEREVRDIKRVHGQEIQKQETRHAAEVAGLNEHISGLKTHHAKDRASLIASYDEQLRVQQVYHDEQLQKQKVDYEEQLREQKDRLEKELAILRKGLTTGDRFQPLPDKVLGIRFRDLKLSVGTLARSPFAQREVNAEKLEVFGKSALAKSIPKQRHKFILESILWAILADGVFSTPFNVLGSYGEHLGAMWSQLYRKHQSSGETAFEWPPPDDLAEKWRYVTLETLRCGLSANMGIRAADEDEIKKSHENHLSKVSAALSEALSSFTFQDNQADIRRLVEAASSLALDFGIQRCRLQIFSPQPGDRVSRTTPATYEDLNDQNPLNSSMGTVHLVVCPGLRRIGAGRGGSFEQSTDICPAGVYLKTDRL